MGTYIYDLIERFDVRNTVMILSAPMLLIFTIITFCYFTFSDKKNKEKQLSGRMLMGIFFTLFTIILFCIMTLFDTACLLEFRHLSSVPYIRELVILESEIPFEILVNTITVCATIYMGIEGSQASLATANLDKGTIYNVPYKKKMRMFTITFLWFYVCVTAIIFHSIVPTELCDFKLENLYLGLSSSCIMLFLANKTPSLLENVSTNKKNRRKEDKKEDRKEERMWSNLQNK